MTATWPDFDIYNCGTRTMRNGHTATIWRAETQQHGQTYSMIGPLKASPTSRYGGYVHDLDAAQEILEKRLGHNLD